MKKRNSRVVKTVKIGNGITVKVIKRGEPLSPSIYGIGVEIKRGGKILEREAWLVSVVGKL